MSTTSDVNAHGRLRCNYRWRQFSLRTLLLAILALSLPFSWFACRIQNVRRQMRAVDALEQRGCIVTCNTDDLSPRSNLLSAFLGVNVDLIVGSHSDISDDDLKYVAELSNVKVLLFDDTKLTDSGLESLDELAHLRELSLCYTRVTDDGLKHLRRHAKLEVLHLDGTDISDAGLQSLGELKSLGSLWVRCMNVSIEGVDHLQEALPECVIVY